MESGPFTVIHCMSEHAVKLCLYSISPWCCFLVVSCDTDDNGLDLSHRGAPDKQEQVGRHQERLR